MNVGKLAGLALAGLLPLSLTGTAVAAERPQVEWGTCDRSGLPTGPDTECGRLTVPVDYAKPSGGTAKLRVFRKKAKTASRGTILNFPGGPGTSGDIGFGILGHAFPGYDLIALDPRGVGESHPMTCDTKATLAIPYVAPTDNAAFEALRRNQEKFWRSCTTGVPGLDAHLDAYTNVRDADALRQALGIKRINIYGFSYGTVSAERYLEKYGQHVNGSVIEGVMNPAQSRREFISAEAAGPQAVFDKFTRWCATTPDCVLHGQNPAEVFRRAQQNADAGRISGTMFGLRWSSVAVTRYFEKASGDFTDAAKGLRDLAEGRNPLPDKPGEELPERIEYTDPIVCQDFALNVGTVQEARLDLAATKKAAPVLGFSTNASNYTAICLGGPKPDPKASSPVSSRSSHSTMVLANTLDPITPIRWAEQVRKQLGAKGELVVTDQVDHGGGLENPVTLKKVQDYMNRVN
ncbi:alpha/beta fold hydrolase [Lentzea sp. NPDC034063]|uniref:alpha/beta fold hydrolase n=1 Tax=unclassified Lentzea TaxID=2643253 RepID=UPI0033FC6A50